MKHQEPATVLVVDDEDLIRMLGCDILELEGYRVVQAANATEALRYLEDGAEVVVLFTDVNMPGPLDGLDLAKQVHDRWPEVKILVTSGRIPSKPLELPDNGRFLSKPYRADTLLDMVRQLTRP